MDRGLIIIREYCSQSQIDLDFILRLADVGLIEMSVIDNEQYIEITQLSNLERYARWHYDLAVNVEGIDVMQNMLTRIEGLQDEIRHLKQYLRLLEDDDI